MIFTQERAPRQTFTYSNSTTETLRKCEKCLKLTIKTPERLSTVFIVNLEHILHLVALNKYMSSGSNPINL